MLLRRSSATFLGLLLLGTVLTACSEDSGGVETGDVVPARQDAQFADEGVESVVALPIGRLEVTAGEPVTKVAAKDTRQLERLEAPEGSVFLPITWQYDAATFGALSTFVSTEVTPAIDLVADGASYRLPAPEQTGEGAESFYVLVQGDGGDPRLKVDFDGVTQEVDLATGDVQAGRAAALYDLPKPRTKRFPCEGDTTYTRTPVGAPKFTCSATRPFRLPYAGSGWSEDERGWLVVTVRTTLGLWNEVAQDLKSGAVYYADGVTGRFRLGRTEAAAVIEDPHDTACPDRTDQGSCTAEYHLVFAAGKKHPRALTIEQDYALRLATVWGGKEAEDVLDLGVTAHAAVR